MRNVKGVLSVIAGLMLMFHAGGAIAYADDRGNNGTIKIVSATDPANDNDNDPKVCSFHIAGMNFDKNSSGTWSISGQGGGAGSGTASGTWAANASGAWQTANMTLANGQYKASAKQTSPATSGGEKQKVFKVACGQGTTGGTNGENNAATPTPAPAQQGGGNNGNAGNQPASMTGTGSRSKGGSKTGTGSKSKGGGGSATGTGSQSKQNVTNAGTAASVNGGTDNTASVSEHGETSETAGGAQGNINVPANNGTSATSGTSGTNSGTAATGATGGSGVQGNLNIPGGGAQGNINVPGSGAQGNASVPASAAQGVTNLPSTSTDQNGPLAVLGGILVAFGALLLRRTGRQLR